MIDGIRAQVTEGMRALSPSADAVFLRTIASTGGDALLGLKGTETATDTEIVPRPFVANASERLIQFSNGRLLYGDLAVVFPPAITEAQVKAASRVLIGAVPYRVIETGRLDLGGRSVQARAVVRRIVEP